MIEAPGPLKHLARDGPQGGRGGWAMRDDSR